MKERKEKGGQLGKKKKMCKRKQNCFPCYYEAESCLSPVLAHTLKGAAMLSSNFLFKSEGGRRTCKMRKAQLSKEKQRLYPHYATMLNR